MNRFLFRLSLVLCCCLAEKTQAQDIFVFQDTLQIRILQDSFCSCVGRHAGEDSKDWGDAIAFSLFTKLDINSAPYRNAELFLRQAMPRVAMHQLDHLLDSLIIRRSFVKCVPLWAVILQDPSGFFKRITELRLHPPFMQSQIPHLREQTGKTLLSYLQNGVSDSIATLFDRQSAFDSSKTALVKIRNDIRGKVITEEMKFEKKGRDSSGIGKMKLLRNGLYSIGGIRLTFQRNDPYAKIETLDILLRDSFREEDLIGGPH